MTNQYLKFITANDGVITWKDLIIKERDIDSDPSYSSIINKHVLLGHTRQNNMGSFLDTPKARTVKINKSIRPKNDTDKRSIFLLKIPFITHLIYSTNHNRNTVNF